MAIVNVVKGFGKEISDLFGVEDCLSMDIRIRMDEPITIKLERFVTTEEYTNLQEFLSKYHIEPWIKPTFKSKLLRFLKKKKVKFYWETHFLCKGKK